MLNHTHFREQQKFTQWWIWLILIGVEIMRLIAIYRQLMAGISFSDHPRPIIIFLFFQLAPILFLVLKLDTIIKDDGIYVRFFPFHRSYRFFPWESIEKSYVRKYSPIMEYGGWGLRAGIARGGRAYNVAGDTGLQLEFNNDSELLIGTQKPDELAQALLAIHQLKD